MHSNRTTPLVLVADDEVYTTILLQGIFEREGFAVKCVYDGLGALQGARELQPDLILLDVQMPGMNGFDVLEKLRDDPATAQIPTILITAIAGRPSDIERGLNLGADDYVGKPFAPRELLARARSKIHARRLEEDVRRRTHELEALLHISEELNQHLEVDDLLNLIPQLVLNILPGDSAAIVQLDTDGRVVNSSVHRKDGEEPPPPLDLASELWAQQESRRWTEEAPLFPTAPSGMIVPLRHSNSRLGVLLVMAADGTFDDKHLLLFEGIGRQAALALRNAQLYAMQAEYALHLEDMVTERTSELASAQQMLIQAEKLASIGRLAASIAHEINNPLQPIRNILDDMLEDVIHERRIDRRDLEVVHESVERIRRIVSQLLEFAGRGIAAPNLEALDVAAILRGIIDLNRKLFEQSHIEIRADLQPLPQISGSKAQLEQVFMNLMLNAKAAMGENGVLEIAAALVGDSVVIRFRDSGSGIAPDKIDHIFEPFYSTRPDGSGLGLSVSYGIVQSHQGKITVESEPGKGATFTIQLPLRT